VTATDRSAGAAWGQPVPLGRTLHVAWINLMKRGRTAVVHEYLAHRCEASGADEVVVERRCRDTDGTVLPTDHTTIECASGQVRAEP
jgi:hypothetical protein